MSTKSAKNYISAIILQIFDKDLFQAPSTVCERKANVVNIQ